MAARVVALIDLLVASGQERTVQPHCAIGFSAGNQRRQLLLNLLKTGDEIEHVPVADEPAQAKVLLNFRQQRILRPCPSFVRSHECFFHMSVGDLMRVTACSPRYSRPISRSHRLRCLCQSGSAAMGATWRSRTGSRPLIVLGRWRAGSIPDARLERFTEDQLQPSTPRGRLQVAFAAEGVVF